MGWYSGKTQPCIQQRNKSPAAAQWLRLFEKDIAFLAFRHHAASFVTHFSVFAVFLHISASGLWVIFLSRTLGPDSPKGNPDNPQQPAFVIAIVFPLMAEPIAHDSRFFHVARLFNALFCHIIIELFRPEGLTFAWMHTNDSSLDSSL